MFESDMTYMICLFNSRQGIQDSLIVDAVIHEVIDGEVTNAHTGEVLEEVGSLTGIDPEVA